MTLDTETEGLKFEIDQELVTGTRFKVIGVGGGGSNAVARMMSEGLEGVEFHVINTDNQALEAALVPNKLAIGAKLTHGLGAGSNPAIGREAALEDTKRIVDILEGADMVFVTAGLGCGTGTGATPVVCSLAKELGALTVAVVTLPFSFEGPQRMRQAMRGLEELSATVDTVIAIHNDKLLSLAPRGTSFRDAFRVTDDVVRQAVQGISDIITKTGLINRDFSDIKATMQGMGYALMGTATAKGENAAVEAARLAINSPLMQEGGIAGAGSVLVNISGSDKLGLHEVNEACSLIREAARREDVQINFGVVLDELLADAVKVTVIATGFERGAAAAVTQKPAEPEFPAAMAEPEPEPDAAEPPVPEPPAIGDDLDTPAYLRRDRLHFDR
ncbi:MAG TPA: cell division protein FtsZ [Bryobacteraceae bacterium]|nr:cell division protein FtsZ [Bryobacteraceae bacterium]